MIQFPVALSRNDARLEMRGNSSEAKISCLRAVMGVQTIKQTSEGGRLILFVNAWKNKDQGTVIERS